MDYSRPDVQFIYDRSTEVNNTTTITPVTISVIQSPVTKLEQTIEKETIRPTYREIQTKPTVRSLVNHTQQQQHSPAGIMVSTMSTPLAVVAADSSATFTFVVCMLLIIALALFGVFLLYKSRSNIMGAFKGFCTGWTSTRSIQTSMASVSVSVSMLSEAADGSSIVLDHSMGHEQHHSTESRASNRSMDNGRQHSDDSRASCHSMEIEQSMCDEQQHQHQQHQQQQQEDRGVPILLIIRQHRPVTEI